MKFAKFAIALIGAAITLAGQNDIVLPHVFAQIMPFVTAIGVYLVPNKPA